MSYMKKKFIQEQEARYARLESEEDRYYSGQVITGGRPKHGDLMCGYEDGCMGRSDDNAIRMDEDWQEDQEMMLDQPQDIPIKCPECKQEMLLPSVMAELDYYQCNDVDCRYIFEVDGATIRTVKLRVWTDSLFGEGCIGILTPFKHVIGFCCLVDADRLFHSGSQPATLIYRVNIGQYKQTCFMCGVVLVEPLTEAWPVLFN